MCEDWDVRPCSAQRPLPKGHAACTGMGWPQKDSRDPRTPGPQAVQGGSRRVCELLTWPLRKSRRRGKKFRALVM